MEEAYNKVKYSKRFKDVNLADGVILNIMFKEMDYNKQFDLIIAIFTRRQSNYGSSTLRLNYIPEKQLCVVNNNIIKNMIEFNFKNNVFSYLKLIDRLDYNYFKTTTSNNNTYYNKRNKKMY